MTDIFSDKAALLSLLMALAVWLAVDKLLAPLRKAAARVTEMAMDKQPFLPLQIEHQDELGELLLSINQLFNKQQADSANQGLNEQKIAQQAIRANAQQLELILRNIPQSVMVFDAVGNVKWLNPNAYELHQLSVGKETPTKLNDFIEIFTCRKSDGTVLAGEEWPVSQALKGKLISGLDIYVTRNDTGKKWTGLYTAIPVRDPAANVFQVIVTINDITERKKHEDQLLLLGEITENSTEGLVLVNASDGLIQYANRRYHEMFGYPLGELVGKHLSVLIAPTGNCQSSSTVAILRTLEEQGAWSGDLRSIKKEGIVFWTSACISTFRHAEHGLLWIGHQTDINAKKLAEERIDYLIYNDPLTALPNRLFAKGRVSQAVAYAQRSHTRFAVLVIGLDNFKAINDSLGHPAGDCILADVACRLRESMQDAGMVSRLVGDEFLVLLNNNSESDPVFQVSERILEIMSPPFKVKHQEISTSVSIGIAVFPNDGSDFETLLKNAYLAMYLAKNAGRNAYRFFDESINTNAVEYVYIRNGLRRALEKGDFVLYYQPQIELCSGKLIGAEALLLWYDDKLGLIHPGRFITIAEESGLIVPIGEWVLQEACRQAVEWQQAGLPKFVIGVNLSAVQFKRGDLAGTVKKALDKSGLEPGYLELELTESILIRETENNLGTIRQLKLLGVKLAIDDFGTGYSGLSYLKRFNVDKIKIDKSFVRDLTTDAVDNAIVQAIIQIAKSLSFMTIAEGIESQSIAEKLKVLGCDEGQGYFYARPMPAGEFVNYLTGLNARDDADVLNF